MSWSSSIWTEISGRATTQHLAKNSVDMNRHSGKGLPPNYDASWKETRNGLYMNVTQNSKPVGHASFHNSASHRGSQSHIKVEKSKEMQPIQCRAYGTGIQFRFENDQSPIGQSSKSHPGATARQILNGVDCGINYAYGKVKRVKRVGGGGGEGEGEDGEEKKDEIVYIVYDIPEKNIVENFLLIHFYFLFIKKEKEQISFEDLKNSNDINELNFKTFIDEYVKTIPNEIINFYERNREDIINETYIEISAIDNVTADILSNYVGVNLNNENKGDIVNKIGGNNNLIPLIFNMMI